MMDKIILKGMKFFAYHGVYAEEQEKGQDFIVDAELGVDTRHAGRTDDVQDSVDYSAVFQTVRDVTQKNKFRLLEKLADSISREILTKYPGVKYVKLCVKKPSVPIDGELEWAAVEIERSRDDQ